MNKLFNQDPNKFYRYWNKQNNGIKEPPSQADVQNFWKGILGNNVSRNRKASWIKAEKLKYQQVQPNSWKAFTVSEISNFVKNTHNWKSQGLDALPKFWIKQLYSFLEKLVRSVNEIISKPEITQQWLTKGTTYLLSMGKDIKDQKNIDP